MRILFFIVSLFLLIGATPIRNRYEKEEDIRAEFTNLYFQLINKKDNGIFTVITSTPDVSQMKEGQLYIFNNGQTKILIRLNNVLYKVFISTN